MSLIPDFVNRICPRCKQEKSYISTDELGICSRCNDYISMIPSSFEDIFEPNSDSTLCQVEWVHMAHSFFFTQLKVDSTPRFLIETQFEKFSEQRLFGFNPSEFYVFQSSYKRIYEGQNLYIDMEKLSRFITDNGVTVYYLNEKTTPKEVKFLKSFKFRNQND